MATASAARACLSLTYDAALHAGADVRPRSMLRGSTGRRSTRRVLARPRRAQASHRRRKVRRATVSTTPGFARRRPPSVRRSPLLAAGAAWMRVLAPRWARQAVCSFANTRSARRLFVWTSVSSTAGHPSPPRPPEVITVDCSVIHGDLAPCSAVALPMSAHHDYLGPRS